MITLIKLILLWIHWTPFYLDCISFFYWSLRHVRLDFKENFISGFWRVYSLLRLKLGEVYKLSWLMLYWSYWYSGAEDTVVPHLPQSWSSGRQFAEDEASAVLQGVTIISILVFQSTVLDWPLCESGFW